MNRKLASISLICIAILAGCSDKEGPNGNGEIHETTQSIEGKVEKGPFVRGSIVELRTLNADLSATGNSYTATIENNFGDFDFGTITVESQYAKMQADGYFYNEVLGELSPSRMTLNAIVDLSDSHTINVNILTHLKSERIVTLVRQGASYREANKQAQTELLTEFGLQNFALKDASQFTITSGDDASGALIAISSLILHNRSVAETVEFLSRLTAEFSRRGSFSTETKETLCKTRNALNHQLSDIESNVSQRYSDLGIHINVKNLAYYFDWDGNGIAGDEIIEDVLSLESNEILVGKEGGTFGIALNTNKPIYTEIPESIKDPFAPEEPSISIGGESIYEGTVTTKGISFTSKIESGKLNISVAKAEFNTTLETSIPLYDARGMIVANVKLTQAGDPSIITDIPRLSSYGQQYMASILSPLSSAYSLCHQINLDYYLHKRYELPISPNSWDVSNCFSYFYSFISRMCDFKRIDAQNSAVYQNICNAHLAMAYLTIVKHWGDAVFYTSSEEIENNFNIARTDKNVVLDKLISLLKSGMGDFPETKVNQGDINSMFGLSQDVIKTLIARCYLEKGEYTTAIVYYEQVYGGYFARWDNSVENSAMYANNRECIYSLQPQSRSQSSLVVGYETIPVIDYKDICFELAECYQYNGDVAKAAYRMGELCAYKYLDQSAPFRWSPNSIAELRQLILSPFFAPYARRTVEGKEILGLSPSNYYQTLWPIPSSALATNMMMRQNAGY